MLYYLATKDTQENQKHPHWQSKDKQMDPNLFWFILITLELYIIFIISGF